MGFPRPSTCDPTAGIPLVGFSLGIEHVAAGSRRSRSGEQSRENVNQV